MPLQLISSLLFNIYINIWCRRTPNYSLYTDPGSSFYHSQQPFYIILLLLLLRTHLLCIRALFWNDVLR